jgi:hypothetical protein
MFPNLASFLWPAGLLGIILSETSCTAMKVRGPFAKLILLVTKTFAFWTAVLLTVCYVDSTLGYMFAPCTIEKLKLAFTPALCILAILGFFVAAWVCLSAPNRVAATNDETGRGESPTWAEKATWSEIKAAWTEWYKQCQKNEAPQGRALRMWAGTLALCAGVCLMSICIEVEANHPMSFHRVVAGFRPAHQSSAVKSAAAGRTPARPAHRLVGNQ